MRFIILIALLKEITCVNVVLMEKLTPCFTEYYSLEIVDGNRFRLAKTIPQLCPEGDLSYQLDEFHYVHSVVLFGGSFLTKGQIRYGTYFAVGCISNYEFHCGTYLEKRNVVFQGMRVNCESTKVAVNKISLKLSSIPFYMAELEVLTLASGKPDEVTMMYRGCFANFTSNEKKFLDDFQWCGKYCSNRSFTYSAIKGDICLCGNNVDVVDMKPDEQCDYPCHASEYSCGGEKTYSVYLVQVQLPYYKGCVNSSHASDLQSRDMTVVKCLQRCDDSYFAMLKNGNSCICTNDNSKFKTVSFEMCNIACLGDPNSNCGGTDHWSVYGTCFKTNPPTLPCSKLFHCARSWNEYGVCEGVCKENYFGEHCIERIPQEFEVDSCIRSDLCKYEKNTKCLYNSIKRSHDCVCINGYWDVEKSSLCVDIDECMFDSCFETSSMCENSIGSYNCRCKTGFQLNGLICQEIVRETSTRHKTHYETQPGLQFASNFSHPLSKVTRPLTKVTHPLTNITPPLTFITHPPLSTHRPLSTQLLSNQSSSLCNYDEHSHKCSCKEGYWKNDNNSCEDIDECFYEACNNKSSICLNTMGSFVCKCYRDYIKITADVCITNATEVYPGLTRNSVFIILVTCFLMTNFLILLCYGWTIDNSDVLINRQE